ncbi:MAG: hypothetical protein PHS49_03900 [Candidatus Gracilibacteria bacterium]|nr:hypothetical protein [Candidatus Gracilibacteria bacterium]
MKIMKIIFSTVLFFAIANVYAGTTNIYFGSPYVEEYSTENASISSVNPTITILQILPYSATQVLVKTSDGNSYVVKVGSNTIIGGLNIDTLLFNADFR